MIRYYIRYHSGIIIFRISPLKNKKDGIDFAMLLSLWASLSAAIQHVGKAGNKYALNMPFSEKQQLNFGFKIIHLLFWGTISAL